MDYVQDICTGNMQNKCEVLCNVSKLFYKFQLENTLVEADNFES